MQPQKAGDLWREGMERTALWSVPQGRDHPGRSPGASLPEAVTLGRPVAVQGDAPR